MAKVQFNIHNVHFAPQKAQPTSAKVEFETPIPLPGAVALSIEPKGETSPFFADGVEYYTTASNMGYEGEFECALITDEFREKILKEVLDEKKVLMEAQEGEPTKFALGFEIDGDAKSTLFWFYNCTATRPTLEAKTNEETKNPTSDTLKFTATGAQVIKDSIKYFVRAKTTEATAEQERTSWFAQVYVPTMPVSVAE